MATFFEDVRVGNYLSLTRIILTQELRDAHVALYGEDWPSERAAEAKAQGIIPSPLVISLVGGLIGKADWLEIWFLAEYRAIFHRPLKVGDEIRIRTTVKETQPHIRERNYGWVWVYQEISVGEEIACIREAKYAVSKKPQ